MEFGHIVQCELNDPQIQLPSFMDESEDEQRLFATWYGDPKKDVLSADVWIQSVQVSISPIVYWTVVAQVDLCSSHLGWRTV
jgi:hypothetical protein